MKRYYFHVRDRWGEALDEEGVELADRVAARETAIKGARSLICAEIKDGVLDLGGHVEVMDDEGSRLFIITFAEAVTIAGLPTP